MASKPLKVAIATVLALAACGAVLVVHRDNARLRQRIAGLHDQNQQAARLREDNRQMQALVMRAQANEQEGALAIDADLARAKAKVDELEQKARASYQQRRAQTIKDTDALTNNREPENGLTRLEYFKNQGQATPSAAFQTFVWAALSGDDHFLAGMIQLDDAAREKGLAAIAQLPETAQEKYSTPEKLAALFFAASLTAQPSAQITDVSFQDGQHATVVVRGLTDKLQKVPLQLSPQGWQIVVPAKMMEGLGKWATGIPPPAT